jgi:hypothetical protein
MKESINAVSLLGSSLAGTASVMTFALIFFAVFKLTN